MAQVSASLALLLKSRLVAGSLQQKLDRIENIPGLLGLIAQENRAGSPFSQLPNQAIIVENETGNQFSLFS